MADKLLTRGDAQVDVQVGGPGNNWQYLSACAAMSGPSVGYGAIETRWCQDPANAGKFVRTLRFRTAPDDITFDVMTKLSTKDKINQLLCPFGLRARWLQCEGTRENAYEYDPLMLGYTPVDLLSKDYDDLVVTDEADNDEIMVTTPANAAYEYMLQKISGTRLGTAAELGDEAIVSIWFCSYNNCGGGNCGVKTTKCSTVYALTEGAGAIYSTPTLLVGTLDNVTGLYSWEQKEITGATGTFQAGICAGSRIIVASQVDGEIAYSDDGGDTWSFVTGFLGTVAAALSANFLFARTGSEIWLAMGGGYLYKSTDGGLTWTAVLSGTLTTDDLASVFAWDEDTVVIAGENAELYMSTNAGRSWTNFSDEIATAMASEFIQLNHAVIPPRRDLELYVATNDGRIFRSLNTGATTVAFTEVAFSGDGVGTLDKIIFYGPYAGELMWFSQTNASSQTRLMRDNSGGAGGVDVEIVAGYTTVFDDGIQLNDFDVCDENYALIAGEEETAYPVIIEVA